MEGQEGDTNAAPIVDLNVAQEAGEFVQIDEEASMRIAWPYIKSTEPLVGGSMLIETPSGFKINASESRMDGKATIIPPGNSTRAPTQLRHAGNRGPRTTMRSTRRCR